QKILGLALTYAQSVGRNELAVTDLLLALAAERGSLAAEILERHGLTPVSLHQKLNSNPLSLLPASPLQHININNIFTQSLSPAVKKVIEKSVVTAWRYRHHYVGTEHLLEALATTDDEETKNLWQTLEVDVNKLKHNISSVLKSTSKFPDITEAFTPSETKLEPGAEPPLQALDFFGTELTGDEALKKIDPVIGREAEITRLINILARRTKNNPMLLGDPGVGKTAIVEGLAKRIREGSVPEWLINKKIYALDLGLVIAGTMYRGEFESRMKQIIDEIKGNPDIILFIDEIHTIVGTGAAPGSLDLANILKPALAKGQIRCIGATTQEEYKKNIESDAALERRFQTVTVREVSPAEAVKVLKGIKGNYEKFHGVKISDDVIDAAVYLSERYLPEKFLPDKAIDLLDEAASHLRTNIKPSGEVRKLRELEAKLKQLTEAKEIAIADENFSLATGYKDQEAKTREELDKIKQKRGQAQTFVGELKRDNIAAVVAQMTGVAMADLMTDDKSRLTNLEKTLSQFVKGQAEAVATVSRFIRRGRLGLGGTARPVGTFMFLGPSGVGKTELAKVVAREVFGDANALVRLDMAEFSEGFNVSKLIGAPAGYVGYKDTNKLTDQVKRRPASVVLFDEIEKAHPDVFNLLLQILDEGHLTDAAGKQINFKNSLIILTSNLGIKELNEQANIGFEAATPEAQQKFANKYATTREAIMDEVKKFFRPEFLNRLDAIMVFNPLTEKNIEEIVKMQINELNSRLSSQKIGLTVKLGTGAAKAIAQATWSPTQGARGVRRFIEEKVENYISDTLLAKGKPKTGAVTIKVKDKEIVVE
ncbi:TPA: ATP-dependent Clp protease ATP-binding subunit ClpC, partial [Patescibacteria group bacterium]|nr:ATP-dependent Clp protease ATP-binding subunit ClpC [Patescibacteria group bacterium]